MEQMNAAVRSEVSFSGHETFVFRYAWLPKAAFHIREFPRIFGADNAMVKLGVGKNMVRSIRHWALSTRVLEELPKSRGQELQLGAVGKLLFEDGGDPYLEDVNSLWLLHWNLARSQERATTWCWAFNIFPSVEFTREGLISFIRAELATRGMKEPSEATLKRDVDCFVRTYAPSRNAKGLTLEDSLDCPLTELGLLVEDRVTNLVRFTRGDRPTLHDGLFAMCLAEFWQAVAENRETLSFADIAFGFGSPGRVFRMDEISLMERLERLEHVTNGVFAYAETAGVKQVYKRSEGADLLSLNWRLAGVGSEVSR